MSEIVLEESTEVTAPKALVEGQPLGVWLDGQREVIVQETVEGAQAALNPAERTKLLGALFSPSIRTAL